MIPAGVTRPSTAALIKYFLYLGSAGFGGPVALIGYMQRDLVERRGWFTKAEYLKSLALSQLMPGPLAALAASITPSAGSTVTVTGYTADPPGSTEAGRRRLSLDRARAVAA